MFVGLPEGGAGVGGGGGLTVSLQVLKPNVGFSENTVRKPSIDPFCSSFKENPHHPFFFTSTVRSHGKLGVSLVCFGVHGRALALGFKVWGGSEV